MNTVTENAWEEIRRFRVRDDQEDIIKWSLNVSWRYSISSAWKVIRNNSSTVSWWKLLWGRSVIPTHSFIVWLALQDRLSVKTRLRKKGMVSDTYCQLCQSQDETILVAHSPAGCGGTFWTCALFRGKYSSGTGFYWCLMIDVFCWV